MRNVVVGRSMGIALAVVLVGCGHGSEQANNQSPATEVPSDTATAAAPDPSAAKLSAYTESYNKLIGTFGLTETAKSYLEENIVAKSPSDSVSITDGWIDQGTTALKKARAMPGGAPALNQDADRLIGSLDKVLARLGPLKIYYDAKSYKEDGLVRGKREDPLMRAEFTSALDALHAFDATLKSERDKQNEGDLANLKAKGDLLGYDTKLALHQSETLVDLFGSEADLKNPVVIAKGDALVKSMEATLADQRQQFASAKARAEAGKAPDSGYSSVADSLTSMIGEYRDIKQSHAVDDLNSMVKEYNNAVESANRIDD